MSDWTHEVVSANGQRMHLVTQGSGPLVLLTHGFPDSWYAWRFQIPALAKAGYRVAAPDMRGYGRSSKPTRIDDYRITELVADCVGIVEALGEREAVIVGHDFGAVVAWTAAWTRPDVFRAVVGMSVGFGGRGQIPVAGAASLGEVSPAEVHRILAGTDKIFYQEYFNLPGAIEGELEADIAGFLRELAYSFSSGPYAPDYAPPLDPLSATPAEVLAWTKSIGTSLEPGAKFRAGLIAPEEMPPWLEDEVAHNIPEFERTGIAGPVNWYRCLQLNWELLAAYEGRPVEVPAMFIGADLDPATIWAAEAISLFPQTVPQLTETVILHGCGHPMNREQPEETNDALLRFLDQTA